MKRLLLMLPLWALAGCKDPKDGVKVVVAYTQFVPGCVRVTATDDASGETLATDVAVREKNANPDGEIVVGVLLPEKWGTTISVTADAFEALPTNGQCGGNAVRNNKQGITVPKGSGKEGKTPELRLTVAAPDMDMDGYVPQGEAGGSDCNDSPTPTGKSINPGATELCNDVDNNCNGVSGATELKIGQNCAGEKNCTGKNVCNPDLTVSCVLPDTYRYWRDQDGDGRGATGVDATIFCPESAPVPDAGYVQATDNNRDDCKDDDKTVNPQATEICNGKDDNCVNGTDEGFDVGKNCTDPTYLCTNGTWKCDSANVDRLCEPPPTSTIPTWYVDSDGDKHGSNTGNVTSCVDPSTGTVTYVADAGGDCNDGNPFTYPSATELCDGEDNNCDTAVDDGACPNGTTWDEKSINAGGAALRSIALYGDGGVWVVGHDSTRAVKRPDSPTFTVLPGTCTGGGSERVLYSVWADSRTETAYIGGDTDILSIQKPDSGSCNPVKPPQASGTTTGLIGLPTDGGVQLVGVASTSNGSEGGTIEWDGGVNTAVFTDQPGMPLFDVSGALTDRLFAVGGVNTPTNKGYILERVAGDSSWKTSEVPLNTPWLKGVHVVSPRLAYAVGYSGTLLKWTGGNAWAQQAGPPDTAGETFSSVLAFGERSIYITTETGNIYYWNGTTWQTAKATGVSLYDIAGNNPGDIWAVGNFGNVFHLMPAPPP
ncbi:MopE-related protein [Corallococcus exercitus]|uniref:MopE-related protein n=1 Tax=Corallococcus exercitus TaxID=2316736 RepID=UPI0035D43D3F